MYGWSESSVGFGIVGVVDGNVEIAVWGRGVVEITDLQSKLTKFPKVARCPIPS